MYIALRHNKIVHYGQNAYVRVGSTLVCESGGISIDFATMAEVDAVPTDIDEYDYYYIQGNFIKGDFKVANLKQEIENQKVFYFTVDTTFDEIKAAYDAGALPCLIDPSTSSAAKVYMPLSEITNPGTENETLTFSKVTSSRIESREINKKGTIPLTQLSLQYLMAELGNPYFYNDLDASCLRDIKAGTTDLTAGTSNLTTGTIYLVYE